MNNKPAWKLSMTEFMALVRADLPDGMFGITVDVAQELLGEVAKTASVLGDPRLDDLMERLGIKVESDKNLIEELSTTLSSLVEWATYTSDWARNGRLGEEPPTHPLTIARKVLAELRQRS